MLSWSSRPAGANTRTSAIERGARSILFWVFYEFRREAARWGSRHSISASGSTRTRTCSSRRSATSWCSARPRTSLFRWSAGPNARTDYHDDPYEEFFYQLRGDIVLQGARGRAGRATSRSARARSCCCPGTCGIRRSGRSRARSAWWWRRSGRCDVDDGFEWYCPKCWTLIHRVRGERAEHRRRTCRRCSRPSTPASGAARPAGMSIRARHENSASAEAQQAAEHLIEAHERRERFRAAAAGARAAPPSRRPMRSRRPSSRCARRSSARRSATRSRSPARRCAASSASTRRRPA